MTKLFGTRYRQPALDWITHTTRPPVQNPIYSTTDPGNVEISQHIPRHIPKYIDSPYWACCQPTARDCQHQNVLSSDAFWPLPASQNEASWPEEAASRSPQGRDCQGQLNASQTRTSPEDNRGAGWSPLETSWIAWPLSTRDDERNLQQPSPTLFRSSRCANHRAGIVPGRSGDGDQERPRLQRWHLCHQVLQSHETQSLLPSLRSICSEAESCLETHWAKYIAEPSNPEEVFQRLRGFPYYTNYEDLTRLEICALLTVEPTLPKKIAFIGSGPLPLTSLCLLKALRNGVLPSNEPAEFSYPVEHISDVKVLNIDHCDAAIAVSSALSMKLGPRAQGMEFVCASGASEAQDLQEFDVVYLAALAGTSQAGKEDLLISVSARMRPGALLVVRTSWGLRSCLYPVRWLRTFIVQKGLVLIIDRKWIWLPRNCANGWTSVW